jgi:hypothetical protein
MNKKQKKNINNKQSKKNECFLIDSCSDNDDFVINKITKSNKKTIVKEIDNESFDENSDSDPDLKKNNKNLNKSNNKSNIKSNNKSINKSNIKSNIKSNNNLTPNNNLNNNNTAINYINNPVVGSTKLGDLMNNINFNDGSQLTFDDISLWHIKCNTNYKKDLIFENNYNIVDKDEINMSVCNSYRQSTIIDDKNLEINKKTKGCIINIYTQDLKIKHEDKLPTLQQIDVNLQTIINQNPTHKFTSVLIVPPYLTINQGFERLSQNTLWSLSHAFNITIFGGSYSVNNDDVFFPYHPNKSHNRIGPLDMSFIIAMIKTNFNKIVIFNHYGINEQYKYYNSCPFKKVRIFNDDGEFIMNNNDYEQYKNLNTIIDKSQHVYKMGNVRKFILDLINNDIKILILNIKYDLSSDQDGNEIFVNYCNKYNINVRFEYNRIIVNVLGDGPPKKDND